MFGFLNLYKPSGITSYQLTQQVGLALRGVKVGHAGTLDPLAEGVLVLGIGPATKLLDYVHEPPKTYRARFEFGWHSETQDNTGPQIRVPTPAVEPRTLESMLSSMLGDQQQTPPRYSALKIDGRRAYKLARKNRDFSLPSRPITIHQLQLLNLEFPHWEIEVQCSKGTYVRTLGHDIGIRLGGGAVMTHLTRTRVANFSIETAWRANSFSREQIADHLLVPDYLFPDLPVYVMSPELVNDLRCGRKVTWETDLERTRLHDCQNRFLGILGRRDNGELGYEIHFANYYADLERAHSADAASGVSAERLSQSCGSQANVSG